MKSEPTLSILVPCYNVEKYLNQCLLSIAVEYDVHQEFKESDLAYYTVRKNGVYALTDETIDSFHCSACASLFRIDIIEKYALRFPEGLNYEDAYWHWCYFSVCNTVSFVSDQSINISGALAL